jgi:hypothetical protein
LTDTSQGFDPRLLNLRSVYTHIVATKISVIKVTEGLGVQEYLCQMRKINTGTWQQRTFYGLTFVVGFFFQPNWFFSNVYSFDLWQDKAWLVNRFVVYSVFSGMVLCLVLWLWARFAKKYL